MKRTSTSRTAARSDEAPKVTQADFDRATFRVKGKTVSKPEWQQAVQKQLGKRRISIMLDTAIVEHFKAAAGERGYQTLINETLRRAIAGEGFVTEMRNALRQELAEYKVTRR
jgi:uncharacterized protein (DUF4415 family)